MPVWISGSRATGPGEGLTSHADGRDVNSARAGFLRRPASPERCLLLHAGCYATHVFSGGPWRAREPRARWRRADAARGGWRSEPRASRARSCSSLSSQAARRLSSPPSSAATARPSLNSRRLPWIAGTRASGVTMPTRLSGSAALSTTSSPIFSILRTARSRPTASAARTARRRSPRRSARRGSRRALPAAGRRAPARATAAGAIRAAAASGTRRRSASSSVRAMASTSSTAVRASSDQRPAVSISPLGACRAARAARAGPRSCPRWRRPRRPARRVRARRRPAPVPSRRRARGRTMRPAC